ncbi:major facilitator superfamily domain-containing protein [Mariannaea sp. PMI_226]|nr:major facilitator superfamily domain-containing protein [Mariannaea sp. PMI_226]
MKIDEKIIVSHSESRTSHEDDIPDIDPKTESRVIRKVDLWVLPALYIVYMSCFIDRANIGNVKVAEMPEDIRASEAQFSTAISVFYVTYVVVEIPAVILVKRFSPRYALFIPCILWTAATIANGFVSNVGGLYACRLVLGAAEGGLFPSLNLYLTLVYDRHEIARRVSYLISCAALSGSIGGLLAYGILQMDGVGGYPGWRWVYIIEGAASIVCVFAVLFGMPTDIRKAYFLNAEERKVMEYRHEKRTAYMGEDVLSWEEIRLAFRDAKVWLNSGAQFFQNVATFGFLSFLPALLSTMGHDKLASNYLTIPIHLSGAIAFVALAVISDKFQKCGPIILATNVLGIVGYVVFLTVDSNAIKYFACFLCAVSAYNGTGMNLAWLNVNMAPQYRRATAIGIQQTLGNSAGVVAGQIYRKSPYVLGKAVSLACVCIASLLVGCQLVYLMRENKKKEMIISGLREDTRSNKTGDRDLQFQYRI